VKYLTLSFLVTLTALFLAGCASSVIEFDNENPDAFLRQPDIINLPYETSERGLILVSANIDDGSPITMVIDSGATRSAVHEGIYSRLEIPRTDANVKVYGLLDNEPRPELILPYIRLGTHEFKTLSVLALKKLKKPSDAKVQIDGIIGLDILQNFYIFFDNEKQVLSLIPHRYLPPTLPTSWTRIKLNSNPYRQDDWALKYFDLRVNGQTVPALFDTGSEYNLINWAAIKHPQIRARRRKLREQWQLEGAIGTFDPRVEVRGLDLRSGPKQWGATDFVVLNLKSMNILGVNGQPFVIAGTNMFNQNTFWLDLKTGEIVLKPNTFDQ